MREGFRARFPRRASAGARPEAGLEKIWESGLRTVGGDPEVTLSQAVEVKSQGRCTALQNRSSGPAGEAGRRRKTLSVTVAGLSRGAPWGPRVTLAW